MLTIGSLIVESLDYIFVVDKNYRIVYNTRYEERLNDESAEYSQSDIYNMFFFDVYPTLKKEESSIAKCIETGEIIINKAQETLDYKGRRHITNNITFPLKRKGELLAVVELSMDVDDDNKEGDYAGINKRFDDFVLKIKKDAGYITFDKILTQNEEMKLAIEKARILASLPNPTLIYGETGTGKELFAQSIINYGSFPKNKVVIQNCAAVPEGLMESILFGTVRGAYTGAENLKGIFEQADGGILFLDELNSIPYTVQSKLLRVLQDGTFRPLGSDKDKHVNVKVIAAMNIEPMEAIEKKIIRSDLFYRFSSGLINLLPLRERKEDIKLFSEYYIERMNSTYNKDVRVMTQEAEKVFMLYPWPGNVRELRNTVESMIVSLKDGSEIGVEQLPEYIKQEIQKCTEFTKSDTASTPTETQLQDLIEDEDIIDYHTIMEHTERTLIETALSKSGGNTKEAARILGIPRETLRYRIQKLGIKEN